MGRDVHSRSNPSTTTTSTTTTTTTTNMDFGRKKTQSPPSQEGLRGGGGGGGWTGVAVEPGPGRLEGFIKTVVTYSVLLWFISLIETNLAHGLWESVALWVTLLQTSQQTYWFPLWKWTLHNWKTCLLILNCLPLPITSLESIPICIVSC